MSENAELKYAKTHEWTRIDSDGSVWVGVSDHAQEELGEIVSVGLPSPGRTVVAGEAVALIESMKTASDIHAPVSGTIVAINEPIRAEPSAINETPAEAWLFRIAPTAQLSAEFDALLSEAAYKNACGSQ